MYYTCLDTCIPGLNKAHSVLCNKGGVKGCMDEQSPYCVELCKGDYEIMVPRPKSHRHCLWACSEAFTDNCNKGDEVIEGIIMDDWKRLKVSFSFI